MANNELLELASWAKTHGMGHSNTLGALCSRCLGMAGRRHCVTWDAVWTESVRLEGCLGVQANW